MAELRREGVIISINPPYTGLLLSGEKPMEFRRKILRDMLNLTVTRLYLYETKNKGGCGKIVGEALLRRVYACKYSDKNDAPYVHVRNACVRELYFRWCEWRNVVPVMEELWLRSARFEQYRDKIGYGYNPTFDFALELINVQKYDEPKDVSEFLSQDGSPIGHAPMNMCYTYERIGE